MAIVKDEPWLSLSAPPPDVLIRVHGVSFHVNKRCMASRSARLAYLLDSNNHIDLTTNSFNAQTFSVAISFCYGDQPNLSSDTVIPIACTASYLEMTEEHSPNNLLNITRTFITTRILPHWSETIKAFKTITQQILPHAQNLGIVHACLKSISEKASAYPNVISDSSCTIATKPSTRRKLFTVDDHSSAEDLTSLSLPLYQLVVSTLACSSIPPENIVQCVYRYAKRWVDHSTISDGLELDRFSQREVIETVEKLMPNKRGAIHVNCLFQLLHSAMFLQASTKCRNGFEARIGKQLPEASAEDLCIPSYGYVKETRYDTKCVIRILSHFSSSTLSELEAVTEILEDFLAEAATDENLRKDEFVELLEVLVAVLEPINYRSHDGVYRVVNIFIDAHGFLTEKEREEICKGLDVRRLSVEASEHAARNERFPLRAVAQVLFFGQLRIRQAIGELREEDEEEEEDEGKEIKEMVEMDGRVSELERECVRMRSEIEKCVGNCGRKDRWKWWKDVFGCKNSKQAVVECNCQVKKPKLQVYPKTSTGTGGS